MHNPARLKILILIELLRPYSHVMATASELRSRSGLRLDTQTIQTIIYVALEKLRTNSNNTTVLIKNYHLMSLKCSRYSK